MAAIESKATDAVVVDRLALLLRGRTGGDYSTTAALALCTTILSWVAQRIRRRNDRVAEEVLAAWNLKKGRDAPWYFPAPLDDMPVPKAIVRLRNASSHGDGGSVHPMNDDHCLRGFTFEADEAPFNLTEDQLREIGLTVAEQFSLDLRAAEERQ